jgi:hypothetical protein
MTASPREHASGTELESGVDSLATVSLEWSRQISSLRREYGRCTEMAAELIDAYHDLFRRERQLSAGSPKADAEFVLSNAPGKMLLPLLVKNQRVVVAPADSHRTVVARLLCADTSDVVTVRFSRLESTRDQAMSVVGETTEEQADEGAVLVHTVRLAAGESTPVFGLAAGSSAFEFAVSRASGNLCVLRLDVESMDSAHVSESPVRRKASPTNGVLWRAQEFLRQHRPERAIDLVNAHASDAERPAISLLCATLTLDDERKWLSHVNRYVAQFRIAPIELAPEGASRFLRLTARSARLISSGPVVSVIMPVFNGERTLHFAATSILCQSWRPLELIIVDDCSTDGTWPIMQRLAQLDDRVRLRRNRVNVGPYVSKNLALSIAQGEYITCHDADDWAHPERIEKQVEAMTSDGNRFPAAFAGLLRLDDSGAFTGFTRVGAISHDGALRLAHISCMFEASFMKEHVGYWDSVRFGADGEMLERLERILGDRLLKARQLSMLSLESLGSLTSDPLHGISKMSGASASRRAYRDEWRRWHAGLNAGNTRLPFPQDARRIEAPHVCVVPSDSIRSVVVDW